jgi:hypothetical protein
MLRLEVFESAVQNSFLYTGCQLTGRRRGEDHLQAEEMAGVVLVGLLGDTLGGWER